jgi:tetratricopeptide (TPR) repeat protein
MATEDWYRNTTWDSNIETDFETRLKRSRGAFHKAQYLRIQASYLLDSSDIKVQFVGVRQMERLISDFPTEEFSVILGQEQLGDYYLKVGDFDKAENYFRIVADHYETKKSRSGTSAIAVLKLAETILLANWTNKFDEAYNICKNFPIKEITFNNDKFYYAVLVAQLCDRLNKKEEAKDYAEPAIEFSKITEPQFNRHKTVGLVKATDKQLRTLEQIANE